jgi:hypothetical protein
MPERAVKFQAKYQGKIAVRDLKEGLLAEALAEYADLFLARNKHCRCSTHPTAKSASQ